MAYFRNGLGKEGESVISDPIYIIKHGVVQDGYSFVLGSQIIASGEPVGGKDEDTVKEFVDSGSATEGYKHRIILEQPISDILNSLTNPENKYILIRSKQKKQTSDGSLFIGVCARAEAISSVTAYQALTIYGQETKDDSIDGDDYVTYICNIKSLLLKGGYNYLFFRICNTGWVYIKDLAIVEMPIAYPV